MSGRDHPSSSAWITSSACPSTFLRRPGCSSPAPRDTLAAERPEGNTGGDPVANEPREEFVTVGDIKTHVMIGGRGDPLLVLHGAGGNRGWRQWMATVAERFTVYAPTP